MLRINVTTAEAVVSETELITAGRKGLRCAFSFNSAWDGMAKTAVIQGVVTRDIALLGGSEVTVPAECLTKPNFPLRIGVYGAKADGSIAIPTIWASFGKILPGVTPSDIPPDELTPDIVAQIQQSSANALLLAQRVMQKAENGEFDGEDGATFTPSVSSEGVISWTNDKGLPNPAPVNIKGETGAPGVPGDDYVLTDEDRADIALDVAETVLERATVSGNPLVISDGVGGTRPLSLLCEVEAAEAVTLTRTGKNIWDSARFLEADGWTLEEDGSYSGYNSELYYSFGRSGKSLFGNTAWNEQVAVSFDLRKSKSSTAENAIEIVLNYADGTKTSRQNRGSSTWQHCSVSSTIGKTIASIQFSYGSKAKIWLKDFQVEFSGASTGYQPYAATVYQLPIPDAPASGTIDLTEAARDAVTMLEGANVVFADCTSLTMTYPVRPAGSGGNVQSVNGKTGEVVLSASDVHALPDTTEIPCRTSQLQNDSGYLTQHQSLAAYRTAADQDMIDRQQNEAIAAKYVKPSSGIPKSDLASAVQTSLGKADTALQSAPVTSVNGQTGAVTVAVPTKTSDLTNDNGFVNAAGAAAAAPVSSVNGQTGAVSLSIPSTASDVGAVAANQGVANANKVLTVGSDGTVSPEDNRFVVTLTPTEQDLSGVMDKTCAEITAAYEAGKDIWLEVDATAMGYDLWRVKATIEAKASGENYGQVMGFLINLQLTPPSMIFIFTEFNTSGDENRYTTQIYPLATGQWTGGSY